MIYNLPKVGDVIYVQLLSWFMNNRNEGCNIYGKNFLNFWVKAIVVKVSDGGVLVSFPVLMELHKKKASYFHQPYVTKMLRRSHIEFSLDDYFTLNLQEAITKQKAEGTFSTCQQYKVAGAVIEDHSDEIMDYNEASVNA